MLLRFTDGTTTITVNNDGGSNTTPFVGATYFPRDPGNADTVAETAQVGFSGAVSSLRSAINDIERMFREASDPDAPDIYVEYRPENSGAAWRSPLTSNSRVVWSEEKGARQMFDTNTGGQLAIIFERANYWEGTETTLGTGTIKNGNTSPYNAVSLTAPAGTLPTPLWVDIENASGAAIAPEDVFLSVDAYAGLTTTQNFLTSPSSVSFVGENTVYMFAVSSAVLGKFAGKDARIIAGMTAVTPSSFYIKARIYATIGSTYVQIAEGREVYVNSKKLIDLGSLPLPPGGVANSSVAIGIATIADSNVTPTWGFVQVTPAKNSMRLFQIGYNVGDGDSIIEDGYELQSYVEDSGARYDIVRRSGGPLMAYPDRTNRLHVLMNEGSTYNSGRSFDVTVKARPRRSTI